MSSNIGKRYLDFILNIKTLPALPDGIGYLNPYTNKNVRSLVFDFYTKYFNDDDPRILVLGINPGRFGAGQTGISFTDPFALQNNCMINNDLLKRRELSSTFIYDFIDKYSGPKLFYNHFLISSICPLGFIRDGKNLNFYDDKYLLDSTNKFIEMSFQSHIGMNFVSDVVIVFGKKNTNYFTQLNKTKSYFKKVITLEHPRYIMQYKRKYVSEYLQKWTDVFKEATEYL